MTEVSNRLSTKAKTPPPRWIRQRLARRYKMKNARTFSPSRSRQRVILALDEDKIVLEVSDTRRKVEELQRELAGSSITNAATLLGGQTTENHDS